MRQLLSREPVASAIGRSSTARSGWRRAAILGAALLAACGGRAPTDDAAAEAERRQFDAVWTDFHAYLAVEHPDVDLRLRPPAGEESIRRFEDAVGRTLPEPVRELYRHADGQEQEGFALFPGYRFAPLEEALASWRIMRHPMIRLLGLLPLGDNDHGVRNRGWHPGWIPIGTHIAGDSLCVDLVPDTGGRVGQIIEHIHDDTPRRLRAPGLTEYLASIRRDLESGALVVHHEWGSFVAPSDVPVG